MIRGVHEHAAPLDSGSQHETDCHSLDFSATNWWQCLRAVLIKILVHLPFRLLSPCPLGLQSETKQEQDTFLVICEGKSRKMTFFRRDHRDLESNIKDTASKALPFFGQNLGEGMWIRRAIVFLGSQVVTEHSLQKQRGLLEGRKRHALVLMNIVHYLRIRAFVFEFHFTGKGRQIFTSSMLATTL